MRLMICVVYEMHAYESKLRFYWYLTTIYDYVTRKDFLIGAEQSWATMTEFITRATKSWATITGFGTRTTKWLSAMFKIPVTNAKVTPTTK